MRQREDKDTVSNPFFLWAALTHSGLMKRAATEASLKRGNVESHVWTGGPWAHEQELRDPDRESETDAAASAWW